jgi:hypothetical protein
MWGRNSVEEASKRRGWDVDCNSSPCVNNTSVNPAKGRE